MEKSIICRIGDHIELQLDNVREVFGHDDSLPFNAEVYIHNPEWCNRPTFVGHAWNDGWGGESNLDCDTKNQRELADKLDNYLKENYKMKFDKFDLEVRLMELIDYVVSYAFDNVKIMKITDLEGVEKIAA